MLCFACSVGSRICWMPMFKSVIRAAFSPACTARAISLIFSSMTSRESSIVGVMSMRRERLRLEGILMPLKGTWWVDSHLSSSALRFSSASALAFALSSASSAQVDSSEMFRENSFNLLVSGVRYFLGSSISILFSILVKMIAAGWMGGEDVGIMRGCDFEVC